MIFHDIEGKPLVINDIRTKLRTNRYWCLDLKALDYSVGTIKVVEENICNSVALKINDRILCVPSYWHILVCDPDSTQLDAVPVHTLANNEFHALVYGAKLERPEFLPIKVIDWYMDEVNVYPTHNRNFMLCHDIGDNKWVSISFSDSYNRFLNNKTANDLIDY